MLITDRTGPPVRSGQPELAQVRQSDKAAKNGDWLVDGSQA